MANIVIMKIQFVLRAWRAIGVNAIVRFLVTTWKFMTIIAVAYVVTNANKRR